MTENGNLNNSDSLKNNKKLRVFLLFLFLSILFWSLIKLSKEYIAEVEFDLVYSDVPNNKLIQAERRNVYTTPPRIYGSAAVLRPRDGSQLAGRIDGAPRPEGHDAVYVFLIITRSGISCRSRALAPIFIRGEDVGG